MQPVKIVMKQIGIPNKEFDVISGAEFEDYLEDGFGEEYVVKDSHYLGDVRDGSGNTLGYKILLILVAK